MSDFLGMAAIVNTTATAMRTRIGPRDSELMHPAAGESDDVYDDIFAAIAADGTVNVVHDGDTWNSMSVIEGETTNDVDNVMVTNIELRLTEAPGS